MNSNLTTDDITSAVQRALETLEGTSYYGSGPWPITLKPFADPMTVIYMANDNETYERSFQLDEMEDGSVNAILGDRHQVESRTVWLPIDGSNESFTFSGSYGSRGSWKGLIFRAGDYPDKGCKVTTSDIAAIATNFPAEGVKCIDSHYTDTILAAAMEEDGARLVRVWTESSDSELHGEIEYPGWLAVALRNFAKKVSVGLDASRRALTEISLCLNPRVEDAAVFAQAALNYTKAQEFNDFRREKPTAAAAIANLAAKASKSAPATRPGHKENHKMNFKEKIAIAWALLTPEQRAQSGLTDGDVADAKNFAVDSGPQVDPVIRAQIDSLQMNSIRSEAEAEFAKLLAGRHVTPSMKPGFLIAFRGGLKEDGQGVVKFSADGDVQRGESVKAVLAAFAEIKPQFNVGERIPVVMSENPTDEDSAELTSFTAAAKRAAGVGGKK